MHLEGAAYYFDYFLRAHRAHTFAGSVTLRIRPTSPLSAADACCPPTGLAQMHDKSEGLPILYDFCSLLLLATSVLWEVGGMRIIN